MERTTASESIQALTTSCSSKFEELLALQNQSRTERLETRLADFNLWADGVGALAKPGFSLDTRLKGRVNDLALVKNVLFMLADSLDYLASLSETDVNFDRGIQNLDSAIKNLARIGVAIRRTGKASRKRRADRAFDPDEHPEFRKHMECVVLLRPTEEAQFELKNDGSCVAKLDTYKLSDLQRRLIAANLKRRHSFLLAQQGSGIQTAAQKNDNSPAMSSSARTPLQGPSHREKGMQATEVLDPVLSPLVRKHDSTPTISGLTHASTAEGSFKYTPVAKNHTPGAAKTQITVIASDAEFPHPPSTDPGREISKCPCCCQSLPIETFSSSKLWKQHIVEDLSPYTCIAENCPTPHVIFDTRHEWERHVKDSHLPLWECPFCDEQDAKHPTMESMGSHLQTRHEDELSDNTLSTLLSWAAVQRLGIESCPLCSSSGPEDSPELVDHVLRHTYEFALRALPWPHPLKYDLNVRPAEDFIPPEDPEEARNLQRWIDEVPHEGVGHPEPELCGYDEADHSSPESTNVSEHRGYFLTNNYFGDMSGDRSSKPQLSMTSSHSSVQFNYFEPHDINHVQEKFPKLDPVITQRLGKALTRRRRYFKHREDHHLRLQERLGLNDDADPKSEHGGSTIASSIPQHLGDSNQLNLSLADAADSEITATSYAPLHSLDAFEIRCPPLPKEHADGPFLCPFCFMTISVQTRYSWKKHIFKDLRPYVCIWNACERSGQEFPKRKDWISHMKEEHWRKWECPLCSTSFADREALETHLKSTHAATNENADKIARQSSQIDNQRAKEKCPLCLEFEFQSIRQYASHVGHHLEQLALFALPNTGDFDEDDDDEKGSSHTTEEDMKQDDHLEHQNQSSSKSKEPEIHSSDDHPTYVKPHVTSDTSSSDGPAMTPRPMTPRPERYSNPHKWMQCMEEFASYFSQIKGIHDRMEDASSNPVTVALIDDGADITHPELKGNNFPGKSFDLYNDGLRVSPFWASDSGHGTLMARLIHRICPTAKIHIIKLKTVKTADSGKLQIDPRSAFQAIEYATEHGAQIISMSWEIEPPECQEYKDAFDNAIRKAHHRDILMFCSASDQGYFENSTYPHASDPSYIFKIGAATATGSVLDFVNDRNLDFIFPGQDVVLGSPDGNVSDKPLEGLVSHTGSSVATALASGLAALVLECVRLGYYIGTQMTSRPRGRGIIQREDMFKIMRRDTLEHAFLSMCVGSQADSNRYVDVRATFSEFTEKLKRNEGASEAQLDVIADLARLFLRKTD